MVRMTWRLCLLAAGLFPVALTLSSCALGTEFDGVWVANVSGITETVVLSRDHWYGTCTGALTGNISASITRYIGSSHHFQAVVSQSTGLYVLVGGPGTALFVTYAITGNQMALAASTSGYPPNAGTPVYTRH